MIPSPSPMRTPHIHHLAPRVPYHPGHFPQRPEEVAMASTKVDETSLTVRLPNELHAEIKERSREDERTVAQTIRHAIKVYLRGTT